MGYSPLHSRWMALFECLIDDHHQIWFDNIYISAKFCLGALNHPKRAMPEGVTRSSNRVFLKQVLHQEVTTRSGIDAVKGNMKAAVLEGYLKQSTTNWLPYLYMIRSRCTSYQRAARKSIGWRRLVKHGTSRVAVLGWDAPPLGY